MKTKQELQMIKYLIIDVDGTLTDSGIYYDDNGNEIKKFCTKDAAGFFTAKAVGIKTIILTGRECPATTRRMQEMKADIVVQNRKDKINYIKEFMAENNVAKEEIGYIGDDINDVEAMKMCGFVGCPEDACKEVKRLADYKSPVMGGHGAARDVIEYILTERGQWEEAYKVAFGVGV